MEQLKVLIRTDIMVAKVMQVKRNVKEKNKLLYTNEEHIRFFLHQLKNKDINDIKYRKKLIKIFVDEIYITEDEIIIIFNVSKQKITLSIPTIDNVKNTYLNTHTECLYNNVLVSHRGIEPPTVRLRVIRTNKINVFGLSSYSCNGLHWFTFY